jgi:XTP/dITP diphosphohydrolase
MKKEIYYVTGNIIKFSYAQKKLEKYKIKLKQIKLDIVEIQSDKGEEVAVDKAKKAFQKLKKPLLVSDTFWEIKSLNNFPGCFMHYVNKMFSAEDFLNLTKNKKNRTATSTDYLVYIDKNGYKVFKEKFVGEVAKKIYQGKTIKGYTGWDRLVKFNGKYLAEHQGDWTQIKSEKSIWEKLSKNI